MLAIHDQPGSFSDRWIEVCRERGIPYTVVDLFADDLFHTLHAIDATAVLMHPPMADRRTLLVVRSILHSCELAGLATFPRVADFWHFDDKVAQKYLFDALRIKTPKTHVFLDRLAALNWLVNAKFPLVFKLRAGAGSINVALLKTLADARDKVDRMFGRGFPATDGALKDIRNKLRLHGEKRDWLAVAKRAPGTLKRWARARRFIDWERGYAYFQEFVPGNDFDTRVTVIGNRAFAFCRMNRPGDFRASGSGNITYDRTKIDTDFIRYAFRIARILNTSCIAFDFIHAEDDGGPLVVEMSCYFVADAVGDCPGYWSPDIVWHEGNCRPQDVILEDILVDGALS